MMKTEFRIYFGFIFLIFLALVMIVYLGYTNNAKCEDAGGVYAGNGVCVNPAAIIEVE